MYYKFDEAGLGLAQDWYFLTFASMKLLWCPLSINSEEPMCSSLLTLNVNRLSSESLNWRQLNIN